MHFWPPPGLFRPAKPLCSFKCHLSKILPVTQTNFCSLLMNLTPFQAYFLTAPWIRLYQAFCSSVQFSTFPPFSNISTVEARTSWFWSLDLSFFSSAISASMACTRSASRSASSSFLFETRWELRVPVFLVDFPLVFPMMLEFT